MRGPLDAQVVVVGAGLAGLRCAGLLHEAGVDVRLIESDQAVGGRVRSDHIDGFILDHGFQLYNPSYPEGQVALDHDALQLRSFRAGVLVRGDRGWSVLADPRREPGSLAGLLPATLSGRAGWPWEALAFAVYAAACGAGPVEKLSRRPDVTMRAALRYAGVRGRMLDRVVGPFLSGVFADSQLTTSRRFADLVLRSMVRGTSALPARGMGAITQQLAARLPPERVTLGVRVTAIIPGGVQTTVGPVRAPHVVVAVPAPTAAELLPGLVVPRMRSLTTWYFCTALAPITTDMLVVDGCGGPLANVAVTSGPAPGYAPAGLSLVAASAVGHLPGAQAASAARDAAARLLGLPPAGLAEVGRYAIRDALPAATAPFPLRRTVSLGEGVFLIGDHRDTPSIQGALVSGRRGAVAVLGALGRGAQAALANPPSWGA